MSLRVVEAGFYATVQDTGRAGFQRLGIHRSGVLDWLAPALLNTLLGNPLRAAVVEMHFPAPRLRFEQAAVLAIGGADFCPMLDGRPLANWRQYRAEPGQTLTFREPRRGRWAYLAVAGGLATPRWLGSASMTPFAGLVGVLGRPLEAGDELPLPTLARLGDNRLALSPTVLPRYTSDENCPIRIVPSAEFHNLDDASQARLLSETFVVGADSNRMATRLEGVVLRLTEPIELVSSAVAPGVIQLPPDGRPTVLLSDAQTTGGYPRIAHIITADLPAFAQRRLGQTVRFTRTTQLEAEHATSNLRQTLRRLAAAVAVTDAAHTIQKPAGAPATR
ncbi:MAG: biotin-dependent carboxyltransferase family protein [Chloracidobacterium sp.]